MKIEILQHVFFEGPANLGTWAKARGHDLRIIRLYAGDPLPALTGLQGLAIMGGPMNIYEHEAYPWLVEEKRFLKQALAAGVPTLGVCLGAQLMADVLGGAVEPNAVREIGWYMVETVKHDHPLLQSLPRRFEAFHWHGDRFVPPPEALPFAASEACSAQGFVYGESALGLQFHLDYRYEDLEAMVEHCGDELTGGEWVQSAEAILASPERVAGLESLLFPLLDRLFAS